jgi:outer membrane receptor protein involved in Fe transport
LLALVPNVQPGSGNDGPTIRGQDSTGILRELQAFLGGTRPRVTLQVDGRAAGYNEFIFGAAPLWDVERVEIFRSPQTTTQGRNSIGGAIFVRTNDPGYSWEGRARVIAGNFATRQGSAAISGPILADQLAFRIAADIRRERTSSRIDDRIPDADPNRDEYGLLRIKLLAEPKSIPDARLEMTYVHQESRAPQIAAVRRPFEERRADALPTHGVIDTKVDSLTAVLDYAPTPALASTTTLYYGDSLIRRLNQPGLGRTRIDARDFSIETVLRWQPDGPVRLLGGVHHLRSGLEQFLDVTTFAPLRGSGNFNDRQRSLGLFGETSLRPLPELTITGGLRYQSDSQERTGFLTTFRPGFRVDYDERFDAWLPKLSVAYEFGDDVTAGLLVQRAFNPGGVTISLDTGDQDMFSAETLWSCEIFARARLAGGRLRVAANLFYNDIKDAQRPQRRTVTFPDGTEIFVTELDNAAAAESYGAELELDWRAARGLSFRAGVGLLKTRILETQVASDPTRGKAFQRSPEFTAAAAVDWRPVAPLRISAQLRHNSHYFSNDANSPALRIEGRTLVDGRAAYTAGPITLFGYVRNLFDAFYLTLLTSPNLGSVGDPREIGLGVEARF